MSTPHRLSLIALSHQIQFCATRHHPDVRLPLLTVSILSLVDLVVQGQIKTLLTSQYYSVSCIDYTFGLKKDRINFRSCLSLAKSALTRSLSDSFFWSGFFAA